jgi:carboxyl-terminal processing protease
MKASRFTTMMTVLLTLAIPWVGRGGDTSESLDPNQLEQINTNLRGAIGGIGVQLEKPGLHLRIKDVLPDTPASRAGLKAGQVITAINGLPTITLKLEDAVRLCRGPVGSKLELEVRDTAGATASRLVGLVRETVIFAGVSSRVIDTSVGLLTITTFNQQTPGKVKAVLEEFRARDLRGLILDLRDNGGGSYPEVCLVAGHFLGDAVPLWLIRQKGQAKARPVQGTAKKEWDKAVVVLVGEKTGGTGELLASALKSGSRAQLLGQTTAGTACLKSLEKQSDGTSQKVLQAHFFTVQDEEILGHGIKPDIALKPNLSEEEMIKQALAALPRR